MYKPPFKPNRLFTGHCPDLKCRAQLFFPSYETSIECTDCGQRHEKHTIHDAKEANESTLTFHTWLRLLCTNSAPKKGVEMVKVLGLSNYHCKLLSPLLTYYGMDKKTGKGKLLKEMNNTDMFDCGILGDRAFRIDREHVEVPGYGRDISGSMVYLGDTLQMIRSYNNEEERLIPVHADGDGHCLVHAISRALVGRELFWHPLRCNLKAHFQRNLDKYKVLFQDFINASEWPLIIEECDPEFQPADGELLGLRNIHVFGLANILKRPIILLDSLAGMQSSGDYSALFVPGLVPAEECRGKNGELNKPICLAWSSCGRNHYIPLVGVRQYDLPRLPRSMLPKVWGIPQQFMNLYMEFDREGYVVIGGIKCLGDPYILKLAEAMDDLFYQKFSVHPALVADVHHYHYKRTGMVGVNPAMVLIATQKAVEERRLYRCLTCDALSIYSVSTEWLRPGGLFYSLATKQYGALKENRLYTLPLYGMTVMYDMKKDVLIPQKNKAQLDACTWCHSLAVRHVRGNGTIMYKNGDCTRTPSKCTSCECCHKHYWDGKEYDNNPQKIPVILNWNAKVVGDKVNWFQNESEPKLNSNVYEVASSLVLKHFPGEFGSERLMQSVVEQILEQTKTPEEEEGSTSNEREHPHVPEKLFVPGPKILHKEELGVSKTENVVRQQLEKGANEQQRRLTTEEERKRMSKERSPTKGTDDDSSVEDSVIHHAKKIGISASSHGAVEVKPAQKPPPRNKLIRVVTSEGRQNCITLPINARYGDLLRVLEMQIGLSRNSISKITYNFPPQELKIPENDDEDYILPFQNGERIQVKIAKEASDTESMDVDGSEYSEKDEKIEEAELGRKMDEIHQFFSGNEELDTDSKALLLAAVLSNCSLWEYVQSHPEYFSHGGVFYLKATEQGPLVDGCCYQFPVLPDKKFRYNKDKDLLELYVEPYGYFTVQSGIEETVRDLHNIFARTRNMSQSGESSSGFSAGSSGVVNSGKTPRGPAFTGQGYTLSSKFGGKLCETSQHSHTGTSSVQTETNVSAHRDIIKLGPGISVLKPRVDSSIGKKEEAVKKDVPLFKSALVNDSVESPHATSSGKISRGCDTELRLDGNVCEERREAAEAQTPSTESGQSASADEPEANPSLQHEGFMEAESTDEKLADNSEEMQES